MIDRSRTSLLTLHFTALREGVRLRMLRILEHTELSVGEVSSVVQLPQSTVSRHLRVLEEGGWLRRREEGTASLYRMVLDDLRTEARAIWLAVREQLGTERDSVELAEDSRRLAAVLAERRTDTQAFFGRIAGEWDAVRSGLFGDAFTAFALLGLLPSEWVVADLGCGTGNAAELLAPVVAGVLAVDQSNVMLKAARKRLRGSANVTFVRADLESLPLEAGCVDAAVCVLVLHHTPEPAAAIREAGRIVRPGGRLLLVDMLPHDREAYRHTMGHRWLGFAREPMEGWVRAAGFTGITYRELPPESAARGPGLFALTGVRAGRGGGGRGSAGGAAGMGGVGSSGGDAGAAGSTGGIGGMGGMGGENNQGRRGSGASRSGS